MNQTDRVQQAADALAAVTGESPVAAKRALAEYDTRDLIASVAAEGVGGGGGGAGAIEVAEATLNNAQIKAMAQVAVEVVPAPGAGKALVPLMAFLHLTWVANYTNIIASTDIFIDYDPDFSGVHALGQLDSSNGQVSDFLAGGIGKFAFMPPLGIVAGTAFTGTASLQDGDIENFALKINAPQASDFTGGNAGNSLKVWTYYATVTL